MSRINRRLFGAVALVGVLTLAAKSVAMGKELLVAHRFGTGDALDALLVAFLPIGYAINVLVGALQSAFVPAFLRVRHEEGVEAAERLLGGVLALTTGGLLLATLLIGALAPLLVAGLGSSFAPDKAALAVKLLLLQLPFLLVNGLTLAWGLVLNAMERFALVALAPTLGVAVQCAVLLAPNLGIEALAVALVVGAVLEGLAIWLGLRRLRLPARPRWSGWTPSLRGVVGQYGHLLVGLLLMSTTQLVDQAMAAMLGKGQVATLNYGTRLVIAGLGLGAASLGTAVLPHFSKIAAVKDDRALRRLGVQWMGLVFLAALPVAGIIYWQSENLVRLLFQRGEFTPDDTRAVAAVQALYALQIPTYLAGIVGVRVLSAWSLNAILTRIGALSLLANVVGNLLLMPRLGVAGIALATSLVYFLSACVILAAVLRGRRASPGTGAQP